MASKRSRILVGVASFGLAALGAAAAWLFVDRPELHRDVADDAAQLALGAVVYAEHCAACHGAYLEGEPDWRQRRGDGTLPAPPHDASGHTWHHSDEVLVAIIRHGVEPFATPGYQSTMPAFAETLDDTEIEAVLAYIKSQWPPEIRRRQERLNR